MLNTLRYLRFGNNTAPTFGEIWERAQHLTVSEVWKQCQPKHCRENRHGAQHLTVSEVWKLEIHETIGGGKDQCSTPYGI